jgi:hypothetical protein
MVPFELGRMRTSRCLSEMTRRFDNRKGPFLFRDTMLKLIHSDNLEYKELTKAALIGGITNYDPQAVTLRFLGLNHGLCSNRLKCSLYAIGKIKMLFVGTYVNPNWVRYRPVWADTLSTY